MPRTYEPLIQIFFIKKNIGVLKENKLKKIQNNEINRHSVKHIHPLIPRQNVQIKKWSKKIKYLKLKLTVQ